MSYARLLLRFRLLILLLPLSAAGCISLDMDGFRKVAGIASWGSSDLVEVRKTPENPLADSLNLFSKSGPTPTGRTLQVLRRFDLLAKYESEPREAMQELADLVRREPSPEVALAFSELAYIAAKRSEGFGVGSADVLDLYAASVAHAYYYLFDPSFDFVRNPYDPQFRRACELYNASLEECLRIVQASGNLRPGKTHSIRSGQNQYDFRVVIRGPWREEDFGRFEFVSDYELTGLPNHYQTFGLGVPLIAVRGERDLNSKTDKYYPPGLAFPVTAFLRAVPHEAGNNGDNGIQVFCQLELCDPLAATDIDVAGRRVPLESDLSTPLAYYLNDPLVRTNVLATFALLHADFSDQIRGLYMLEPYDPERIPVVMVHGLWSSPVTWMEMFNDLRAMPEIRKNYQFWFYLYPTGQPFWVSGAQFRADLAEVRQVFDPGRQTPALDQMVLVGHSMGGLVSKLQTIDSRDDYWKIVSDKPFEELEADDETRANLAAALFFRPNPSIRRVITLGTPHHGSNFATGPTQWVSHKLIRLPSGLMAMTNKVVRDNPDYFTDTKLLTMSTSIDSLSPECPIFPVFERSPKAPWVRYHNVVGRAPSQGISRYIVGDGDTVVALVSAEIDNAESQIVVPAAHTAVHRHPRAILEVRRILLEHLVQARAEMHGGYPVTPAGYSNFLPARSAVQAP